MKNIRKWGAWLGAGAVIVTFAGCADRNNNGQPESLATTEEVAGTVKKGVDKTENAADKTGAAVTNAGKEVAEGAEKAVDATGKAVEDAGTAVAQGAEKAVDATGKAIDNAGTAIAKGADKAVDATSGAGTKLATTSKVKTAIGASSALKGTTINVDTMPEKKTVALRGTVKSASQKNLAAQIAKREAPGMTIANQLVVKG